MNFWFLSALFWENFGTYFWWIMSCHHKYLLRQHHSFWQSSLGRIKILTWEGEAAAKTLTYPFFPSPAANTPMKCARSGRRLANYSVAQFITRYWAFHCLLIPSFVLLGTSAKSRCLEKLSHPSLASRQVKRVRFSPKLQYHNYKISKSSFCPNAITVV